MFSSPFIIITLDIHHNYHYLHHHRLRPISPSDSIMYCSAITFITAMPSHTKKMALFIFSPIASDHALSWTIWGVHKFD
jgi:hypothetical protein